MRRLRYSSEALDNIADIAGHVGRATGSRSLAERLSAEIRKRCRRLATLPGTLGRSRTELRRDLRSLVVKEYVVFFRYTDEVVEIVAVIHGHRDVDSYFAERGS